MPLSRVTNKPSWPGWHSKKKCFPAYEQGELLAVSDLLEVQIDDAVLAGLHLHPDVEVLLRRIVKPGAVGQPAEGSHLPVLAILKLHAARLLRVVYHPLVIALLLRFDFQPHAV